MEKLLYSAKKKRKNNATILTGQRKKNSCFSCGGYSTIFCRRTAKTFLINLIQDDLS
jgi:hypothetical protein